MIAHAPTNVEPPTGALPTIAAEALAALAALAALVANHNRSTNNGDVRGR